MTFVQRNRLRAALAVLLAAVSVLVLLTRLHYAPVLAQLAALQLDNQASAAINDAVQDTLTAEEITYDKLVELEKDTQGNVTAVRSNVAGLNRFSTVGINQTLHQIFIDIHVTVTILSLTGTQEIVVDATVLAAETVIVGNVPSTYIGLGGPEEEGT